MKLYVFSIYDKAVGAFVQPFYSRSQGEALRSFSEAVNKEGNQLKSHASDYTLYRLGEWDDNNGLYGCSDPIRVISALECLADAGRVKNGRPGERDEFVPFQEGFYRQSDAD